MKIILNKKYNQKGQISRLLLIGAGVVLIIIIIVFAVIFFTRGNKSQEEQQNGNTPSIPEPPKPVYDKQVGDIYFILESSDNLGNILDAKDQYQKDLTTTEKFIRVVVAAQNKGKVSTPGYAWDLGNLVDSEGRIFNTINNQAGYFLPRPNPCGLSLKPEFYPVACTKLYEVAKISKGLKVELIVKDQKQKEYLDLNLDK